MAIYFFDKNQTLIKIAPDSATFEAIQTQELDDDSLLKDTLSVTVKGDEKLLDAEYMAVKSYTGNAQTFDMYRIVTDSTPDKTMTFTGMSLAPYELNGHILKDLRPSNQSVEYTLKRILDGTDWRLGYIDDGLPNVTTTFYYVSAKEALKELQSLVGCEFVFKVEISGQKITDKWIEIYKEMGNRTKKRFNYGTNALTVVRETNKADIYTALIGRGKGEEISSAEENESGQAGYGRKITFEDIEWSIAKGDPLDKPKGQYYLELPKATQVYGIKNIDGTMSARVGVVDFDDETDKNRLINLTYQQLLVSSRPKVLFKTTVANIGATGIGDTVTIHRHDLGIHYQTRVRKIVRNKLNDNKSQIELGDAVVTASTKRAKENNTTIKNLTQELEKVKDDVTTSQTSADGKNTIFYGSKEPERQRTGDTWYRPHPSIAGETQMLVWNGNAWELVVDSSDLTSVAREVEAAIEEVEKAVQAAEDADVRANEAIEKAGANANLLTTHQNTLNTIKNTTIPNINSSISDAMAEAQSALSSASSAMDEAKKADGKIAGYVTKNGLVSGTTVDSKIDDATGEINKKITTVESKIPTEIGGRNLLPSTHSELKPYTKSNWDFNPQRIDSSKLEFYGIKVGTKLTYRVYIDNPSENALAHIQFVKKPVAYVQYYGNQIKAGQSGYSTTTLEVTENDLKNLDYIQIAVRGSASAQTTNLAKKKLEIGSIPTDWTPAPEDNYTQEEFSIFESTYKEDVKGINSSLTDLSNKKLDGSTYTTFYNNEYKKTAQGVTDTYTKLNKITDANGNSTDAFAKAVYDRNATRQSADFQKVTKDLVKTATYTAGINGINNSISSVQGKIDDLSGARNLLKQSWHNSKDSPAIISTSYGIKSWELEKPLELGKTYTFRLFGYTNREMLRLFTPNGMKVLVNNMSHTSSNIIRRDNPYNGLKNRFVWEGSFTITQDLLNNMTANRVHLYNHPSTSSTKNGEIYWATLVEGTVGIDWSPSLTDNLGKAEFTVFKNTYDETARKIESRLTSIDSGAKGSVVYNTNLALSTAQGNTKSITSLNTKVDGLKIGGRNLISGTDDLTNIFGSGYGGSSIKYYKDYEVAGTEWGRTTKATRVVITKASGTSGVFTTANHFKMIFGKPYTLSFYVKNLGQNRIQFNLNGLMLNPDGTGGQSIYVNGGESGKFSATGYMRNNPEWNWFQILPVPANGVTSMDFAIAYLQVEEGNFATDWTPALADQMGKAEFTLFKKDYDETAKGILSRLTAIDSSAEGSVVTRLNKTEKTASGNSTLISTINKNYVKQSNIDASILADKKIKDTRSTNQLPSWYFSKYPTQEVREFKQVSTMGIGSGTYGILTTNVPWSGSSGGTVKQTFETNTETHVRQSNSAGTAWGAWAKQIDTSDTTYQKVTQTSSLYERVLGSTENNLNTNISRIVQTSEIIQQTVTSAMNVENRNLLITKNATKDSWLTGSEGYPKPSSQPNSGTSTSPDLIEVKKGDKFTLSKNETTLYFRVSFLNSSKKYIGRYVQNAKSGTITPPSGTAYMWVSYPTNADAKVEKGSIATGYSPAPEDTATQSHITQLSNNINLKVSKNDISNQININTQGVVIQGGKISLSGDTTVDGTFWTKQVNAVKVNASNITTGTLNASKVKVINLDANNITANKTSFVQSAWNAINSRLTVNGSELKYTHSDGSYTRINANGIQTVVGGSAYQHNYLMHVENITINSNSGGEVKWVQLPSVFKGKQFRYFMGATDIYGAVTEDAYYQNKMMLKRFVLIKHPNYNVDYANARIPILGYAHYADIDSRKAYYRALQGIVVAQF